MKKKLIIIVVYIFVSMFCFGCTPVLEKYAENISEIRNNLYEGKNGSILVDAITGYREEPFEIDGHTSKKQNFTVITIYPTEYTPSEKYAYKVILDGTEYSGDMIKHPFNNTYSAEIEVLTISSEIEFSLTHKGKTNNMILTSIIEENYINAEKALEIGVKKLSSGIHSLKNDNINYEIYIRLIKNPISSSGGYHWYVAFVGENDVTYAVLIDPVSLDIVAIRN